MPSNPDLTLYPSATGAALDFATAHTDAKNAPFTLYGSWFCPFVQRVWIVLHLKSIPHRYVEINPYHKAAEFLARNPRGLVPTLAINDTHYSGPEANNVLNSESPSPNTTSATTTTTNGNTASAAARTKEKVLYESLIIATYLDTLFPSHHRLLSANAYTLARQQIWIDWIGTKIVPAFYRFLQHTPEKNYSISKARDEFVDRLRTVIKEMHPTGPWFGGEEISMVDVALIPWAERIFLLDHYKGGSGVGTRGVGKKGEEEEEEEGREVWNRWWRWGEAVQGCESVRATMSEREKYIEAYQRYAEDTTGSEVGKATRGGRGLP